MRAALVVTGVLGTGSALVFAVAALVSSLFPSGTLINAGWNGGWDGGWGKPGIPMPMPMPVPGLDGGIPEKGVVIMKGGDVVTIGGGVDPTNTGGDVLPQP